MTYLSKDMGRAEMIDMVECPDCGATAGKKCWSSRYAATRSTIHRGRMVAARKIRHQEIDDAAAARRNAA